MKKIYQDACNKIVADSIAAQENIESARHAPQQPKADICPVCQRKFYGEGVAGFCSDSCNAVYYDRI